MKGRTNSPEDGAPSGSFVFTVTMLLQVGAAKLVGLPETTEACVQECLAATNRL